jgi:hypothetical protein
MRSTPSPTPRQLVHIVHNSLKDGLFVRRPYIKAFGLLKAVLLEELIFLDMHFNVEGQSDSGSWFYRFRSDLEERTGLSEEQQKRLTKELREEGFLEVRKGGPVPARNWYRINYELLHPLLLEHSENSNKKRQKSVDWTGGSPRSRPGESPDLKRGKDPEYIGTLTKEPLDRTPLRGERGGGFPWKEELRELAPALLQSPDFRQAWKEWDAFRREEKRVRLTKRSVREQLKGLAQLTPVQACACISSSISGGYQGLFPDKFKANGSARPRQNGSNRFSNTPEHTADGVERLRQRKKTVIYNDREGEGA